jgi:hypothetical protein
VFSSPFYPKFFRFWFIILQNETNHHAKFLTKRYPFSILVSGEKKKAKKPSPILSLFSSQKVNPKSAVVPVTTNLAAHA